MSTTRQIPIKEFGKDHWSLLAYIETRIVSYPDGQGGTIDTRHLRCNPASHPLFKVNRQRWKPEYSTRLGSGTEQNHDDLDCLDDLQAAGLITGLTGLYQSCKLTEEGERIAKVLRVHKATGGNYADFILPQQEAVAPSTSSDSVY